MSRHSSVVTTPTQLERKIRGPDLTALRAGERDELARVYREHGGGVLRTLRGVLGNDQDAEDALHDLFVGLPEAIRRYEDRGLFGPWLRRVAVRLALQRFRKCKRRGEVDLSGAQIQGRRAEAEGLPDQITVDAALQGLPEPQRIVVALRELEGWSHKDIAAFLGIRPSAVMARHSRALKTLRTVLEGDR